MDPMEIMMEIIDFPRFRLKTKQERTLYFSLLEYSDSRKTTFLTNWSRSFRNSQLAILYSQSSQFALGATFALFDSSKATLPRMMYLTLRHSRHCTETIPGTLVSANCRIFLSNPD